MKSFRAIFFLGAFLPVALTLGIPPPDGLCKPGAQHCQDNNIQECNSRGVYHVIQQCSEHEICTVVNVDGHSRCECRPKPYSQPTSVPDMTIARTDKPDYCPTVGDYRCNYINMVEQCSSLHMWLLKEDCGPERKCTEGNGTAQCAPLPTTSYSAPAMPSKSSFVSATSVQESCTSGGQTCGKKVHRLSESDEDHSQAYCQRRGIYPLRLPREAPQCIYGDYACDKERRFLFMCNPEGRWVKTQQCYKSGACQLEGPSASFGKGRLYCSGFPLYEYETNRICTGSCEFSMYLYCIGADWDKPEVIEDCLKGMCEAEECLECDRCHYKPSYGIEVVPDLSTLYHGSPQLGLV